MPKVLDLNAAVTGTLKLITRLIGEDIDLVWRPNINLWPVKMDPSQIDQVLTNLCVNARDAIADVGTITIESSYFFFDENCNENIPGAIFGEYVRLDIRDTGCGIEGSDLEHIFEPFYTTKEEGKGTGLGLATVYGIVKQNGGFITVESCVGEGTIFSIFTPRHVGDVDQNRDQGGVVKPEIRGHETVLVDEDETAILSMAKSMLECLGYNVLTANSPHDALRIADNYGEKIHLLMTDVVMPKMNGRDLADKLSKSKPGLKCLFMFGYTADVISRYGVLDDEVFFLQKPFAFPELSMKVRQALAA